MKPTNHPAWRHFHRKLSIAAISLLTASSMGIAFPCEAGDIVNGWGDAATITEMRYQSALIDFRLTSSMAGCGTPSDSASYWRVSLDASEVGRYRRAALLAAYLSGKRVQLRCEQSMVSDFLVVD